MKTVSREYHLNFTIKEGQFCTKSYEKTDGFSFTIVRFHTKIHAEFLRICRAKSSCNCFVQSVYKFISRMKKQGAEIKNIIKALRKMIF